MGTNLAKVVFVNCSFSHNKASVLGGAVFTQSSDVSLLNTQFDHNSAYQGGALALQRGSINAVGGRFLQNTASRQGGAIYGDTVSAASSIRGTASTLTGVLFDGNGATNAQGGAVYLTGSQLALHSSVVRNGQALTGAGMCMLDSALIVVAGTFQNNLAMPSPPSLQVSDCMRACAMCSVLSV